MKVRKTSVDLFTAPLSHRRSEQLAAENVIWDGRCIQLLQKGNQEDLEEHLTTLCFSVLDLSEEKQVFILRTSFISLITHIMYKQSKKSELYSYMLYKAYNAIYKIEQWENVSEFILGIPWYVSALIDDLLATTSLYTDCPHLKEALDVIQDNLYSNKLTVQWLAEQLELSTTHLSNLFKLHIGLNASQFIARKRINEIAYMMIHTSKSLKDIRKTFGFKNHSHFIQYFKRHKGTTPLKYRQQILNLSDN